MEELPNVKLQQDYAYYLFQVNKNLLVWYEGYTNKLFLYDLETAKVDKIPVKQGRGPHELQGLFDLFISNDQIVYLLDFNNAKYIRVTASGEFLKDLPPSSGFHPISVINNDRYRVLMDAWSREAIFFLWDNNDQYIPIKPKDGIVKEEFSNLFNREGRLAIQGKYLVHVTKYFPFFYIYDLNKEKLDKKIQFDESDVSEFRKTTRSDGSTIMAPPSKVDILNEDVAPIPGALSRVFLLAKGKTGTRDYDLSKLYEYDFDKEQFVGAHDLGVKAAEITVNEEYLFVYSKEENKIFRYQIVEFE